MDTFNLFTDFDYEEPNDNVFVNTVLNAVKEPPPKKSPAPKKIQDFGEKIGGARKDLYVAYRNLLAKAMQDESESLPFAKYWPKPDYLKLLKKHGMDQWRVDAIRAFRDYAAEHRKHSRRYSIKRIAKECCILREAAMKIIDGDIQSTEELSNALLRPMNGLSSYTLAELESRVYIYSQLGHEQDFSQIYIEHFSWARDPLTGEGLNNVYGVCQKTASGYGNHIYCLGQTPDEALSVYIGLLAVGKGANDNQSSSAGMYKVYYHRDENKYFIGRKIGSNLITVKSWFTSSSKAWEYKNKHIDELEQIFASLKDVPNERGEENAPRTGIERRSGNVSPDEFLKTFGFRGVEFGNYVENDRRQQDLNQAYDALLDLAQVTGLPPRALSLGGTLGLAFGARGRGGVHPALAHYEPYKTVINLTKAKGAGSLGHEWFHALDNALARTNRHLDRRCYISENYWGKVENVDLPPVFDTLNKSVAPVKLRGSKLDKYRSSPYWVTTIEVMARSFEVYLKQKLEDAGIHNDYLVNVLSPEAWEKKTHQPYAYPTKEELEKITPAFDALFSHIKQREEDSNIILYSSSADLDAVKLEKQCVPYDKLSPEELGFHALGEQALGIQTAFYDGDPRLHGHFNPATSIIYLNRSSECDLGWVFSHEAFHAMKIMDEALYGELMEYAGTFTAQQLNDYRADRGTPGMPDQKVREEMIADAFADYRTGRRIISDLARKRPNTLRKALNFLKATAEQVRDAFWGTGKGETKEKYPTARLSDQQFERFTRGIKKMRTELMKAHRLTEGQEALLELTADAPPLETYHSPFAYNPKKQIAFDCEAAQIMSAAYPPKAVCKAIRDLSPCGSSANYEAKLLKAVIKTDGRL